MFDQSKNTGAIDVKMDGSALEEKSFFKMLVLTFSSTLHWGSYIISIVKAASKKIAALICSMKFLSPEVTLYLYKCAIWLCMEYCFHVFMYGDYWISYRNKYAHCWNVASLSLFYRYYFGRCSSELAQLVPLPFSRGRSTRYSDRLHDFSVTIPRCYKDAYVNSFFPHTARLWNSLSIDCFSLTYDLGGFTSRVNRHVLTVCSF